MRGVMVSIGVDDGDKTVDFHIGKKHDRETGIPYSCIWFPWRSIEAIKIPDEQVKEVALALRAMADILDSP